MKHLAYVTALAMLALAGCGPKQEQARSSAPTPASAAPTKVNPTDTAGEWEVSEAVGDYSDRELAWPGHLVNMEPADMTAGQVHLRFSEGSTAKFEELGKLEFQRIDKANMIPQIPAPWKTATSAVALADVSQEIIGASYDYYSATGTLSDRNGKAHPVKALFVPAQAQVNQQTIREFALVIVNVDEQPAGTSTDVSIVQGGVIHGPGH